MNSSTLLYVLIFTFQSLLCSKLIFLIKILANLLIIIVLFFIIILKLLLNYVVRRTGNKLKYWWLLGLDLSIHLLIELILSRIYWLLDVHLTILRHILNTVHGWWRSKLIHHGIILKLLRRLIDISGLILVNWNLIQIILMIILI